jgi:PAS domain S-box-containing protein
MIPPKGRRAAESGALPQAEKKARASSSKRAREATPPDSRNPARKLNVREIELRTQNEELRRAYAELSESHDRYSDLYDFAPVGYITLNQDGKILEGNLRAASMLGLDRKSLLKAHLSNFITPESQYDWHSHHRSVFASRTKQTREIAMRRPDGARLFARLESVAFGPSKDRRSRVAMLDITQQKAAEEALGEFNRTLGRRVAEQTSQIILQAAAIAHLAEGVAITEGPDWLQSTFRFVNTAMCGISGFTVDELMGRPRTILNGVRTDARSLDRITRELSRGETSHAELIQYRKDGSSYRSSVLITPLPSLNDKRMAFVSIHRDITESKRADQALREREQRFRRMADQAPVMIWISGVDKSCTWFNKPWLDFTGRSLEQELGNGWTDGVHREDLIPCVETYGRSFDRRETFIMEYRLRRRDGQWRWILDHGVPLHAEDGEFLGYIGSCLDVTDRKRSEDALREREGRLQAILNTAADSIVTIDRNEVIVAANPATEQMFGYTHEELLGQKIRVLMSQPRPDEHDSYIARYFETAEARMTDAFREMVGLRKDGSTFPVELAVSEIPHLGLFTGIHRDISARKQAERELDQYRKDLKILASELMLAEERERQRLAEDLHDTVGQALFRARLKIDQLATSQPAAKEAGSILEEVGRMMNRMAFELSPPVLRKLGLRAALKSLSAEMQQRYGLAVDLQDDGQGFLLDEHISMALFRAVRELLINIVKHADTNRAGLSVRKAGRKLQIEVSDKGKGFDVTDQVWHVESGHYGLFSIQERLGSIGATFKIRSAPGKGVTAAVTVSLKA